MTTTDIAVKEHARLFKSSPAYEEKTAVALRVKRIQDYRDSKVSLLKKVLCVVSVVGVLILGLIKFHSYVARARAVDDLKKYTFSTNFCEQETANKAVYCLRKYGILSLDKPSLTTTFKHFDLLEKYLPETLKQIPEIKEEVLLFLKNRFDNNQEEISFDSVRKNLASYFESHPSASEDYQRKCREEAFQQLGKRLLARSGR